MKKRIISCLLVIAAVVAIIAIISTSTKEAANEKPYTGMHIEPQQPIQENSPVERIETIPEPATETEGDTEPVGVPIPTPEPQYVINLTKEEYWDFCHIVAAESGGEPLEGQIAVAAVIINRIQSSKFPDTFYGVITQKNQFATVRNGKIVSGYYKTYEDIPARTFEAVNRALQGEDPTEDLLYNEAIRVGESTKEFAEGGALFFYSPKGCGEKTLATFQKAKVDVAIKNHVFFKVWPK